MFKVRHTGTGRVFTVYAVSGTYFLLFIRDPEQDRWEWQHMDRYEPVEETV